MYRHGHASSFIFILPKSGCTAVKREAHVSVRFSHRIRTTSRGAHTRSSRGHWRTRPIACRTEEADADDMSRHIVLGRCYIPQAMPTWHESIASSDKTKGDSTADVVDTNVCDGVLTAREAARCDAELSKHVDAAHTELHVWQAQKTTPSATRRCLRHDTVDMSITHSGATMQYSMQQAFPLLPLLYYPTLYSRLNYYLPGVQNTSTASSSTAVNESAAADFSNTAAKENAAQDATGSNLYTARTATDDGGLSHKTHFDTTHPSRASGVERAHDLPDFGDAKLIPMVLSQCSSSSSAVGTRVVHTYPVCSCTTSHNSHSPSTSSPQHPTQGGESNTRDYPYHDPLMHRIRTPALFACCLPHTPHLPQHSIAAVSSDTRQLSHTGIAAHTHDTPFSRSPGFTARIQHAHVRDVYSSAASVQRLRWLSILAGQRVASLVVVRQDDAVCGAARQLPLPRAEMQPNEEPKTQGVQQQQQRRCSHSCRDNDIETQWKAAVCAETNTEATYCASRATTNSALDTQMTHKSNIASTTTHDMSVCVDCETCRVKRTEPQTGRCADTSVPAHAALTHVRGSALSKCTTQSHCVRTQADAKWPEPTTRGNQPDCQDGSVAAALSAAEPCAVCLLQTGAPVSLPAEPITVELLTERVALFGYDVTDDVCGVKGEGDAYMRQCRADGGPVRAHSALREALHCAEVEQRRYGWYCVAHTEPRVHVCGATVFHASLSCTTKQKGSGTNTAAISKENNYNDNQGQDNACTITCPGHPSPRTWDGYAYILETDAQLCRALDATRRRGQADSYAPRSRVGEEGVCVGSSGSCSSSGYDRCEKGDVQRVCDADGLCRIDGMNGNAVHDAPTHITETRGVHGELIHHTEHHSDCRQSRYTEQSHEELNQPQQQRQQQHMNQCPEHTLNMPITLSEATTDCHRFATHPNKDGQPHRMSPLQSAICSAPHAWMLSSYADTGAGGGSSIPSYYRVTSPPARRSRARRAHREANNNHHNSTTTRQGAGAASACSPRCLDSCIGVTSTRAVLPFLCESFLSPYKATCLEHGHNLISSARSSSSGGGGYGNNDSVVRAGYSFANNVSWTCALRKVWWVCALNVYLQAMHGLCGVGSRLTTASGISQTSIYAALKKKEEQQQQQHQPCAQVGEDTGAAFHVPPYSCNNADNDTCKEEGNEKENEKETYRRDEYAHTKKVQSERCEAGAAAWKPSLSTMSSKVSALQTCTSAHMTCTTPPPPVNLDHVQTCTADPTKKRSCAAEPTDSDVLNRYDLHTAPLWRHAVMDALCAPNYDAVSGRPLRMCSLHKSTKKSKYINTSHMHHGARTPNKNNNMNNMHTNAKDAYIMHRNDINKDSYKTLIKEKTDNRIADMHEANPGERHDTPLLTCAKDTNVNNVTNKNETAAMPHRPCCNDSHDTDSHDRHIVPLQQVRHSRGPFDLAREHQHICWFRAEDVAASGEWVVPHPLPVPLLTDATLPHPREEQKCFTSDSRFAAATATQQQRCHFTGFFAQDMPDWFVKELACSAWAHRRRCGSEAEPHAVTREGGEGASCECECDGGMSHRRALAWRLVRHYAPLPENVVCMGKTCSDRSSSMHENKCTQKHARDEESSCEKLTSHNHGNDMDVKHARYTQTQTCNAHELGAHVCENAHTTHTPRASTTRHRTSSQYSDKACACVYVLSYEPGRSPPLHWRRIALANAATDVTINFITPLNMRAGAPAPARTSTLSDTLCDSDNGAKQSETILGGLLFIELTAGLAVLRVHDAPLTQDRHKGQQQERANTPHAHMSEHSALPSSHEAQSTTSSPFATRASQSTSLRSCQCTPRTRYTAVHPSQSLSSAAHARTHNARYTARVCDSRMSDVLALWDTPSRYDMHTDTAVFPSPTTTHYRLVDLTRRRVRCRCADYECAISSAACLSKDGVLHVSGASGAIGRCAQDEGGRARARVPCKESDRTMQQTSSDATLRACLHACNRRRGAGKGISLRPTALAARMACAHARHRRMQRGGHCLDTLLQQPMLPHERHGYTCSHSSSSIDDVPMKELVLPEKEEKAHVPNEEKNTCAHATMSSFSIAGLQQHRAGHHRVAAHIIAQEERVVLESRVKSVTLSDLLRAEHARMLHRWQDWKGYLAPSDYATRDDRAEQHRARSWMMWRMSQTPLMRLLRYGEQAGQRAYSRVTGVKAAHGVATQATAAEEDNDSTGKEPTDEEGPAVLLYDCGIVVISIQVRTDYINASNLTFRTKGQ